MKRLQIFKMYVSTLSHYSTGQSVMSKDGGQCRRSSWRLYIPDRGERPTIFGGKERTALSDLQFIDFEARLYDPQLGMFWTADPMMEDYYPYSYRLYCMANLVNLVDPMGCVVKLNGDTENMDKYCSMLSNATGTQFSVDGDGILSAGDKIDTKGRTSETLLNVAMSAIESEDVHNLDIVGKGVGDQVFIDSYYTMSIDVDDLEKAGKCNTAFQGALIGHFLNEIQEPGDFNTAHAKSRAVEGRIYGELVGDNTINERLDFPTTEVAGKYLKYIYQYTPSHRYSVTVEGTQRLLRSYEVMGVPVKEYERVYEGKIKSIKKDKLK